MIHKFDSKLPRLGKGEFSEHLLTHELYKKAIKENPEFAQMSWTEFQKIWIYIAEELKTEVCNNPLGIKLPFFLGEIKTQYLPYKKEMIDRHVSQQEGEKIPNLLIHSKGKVSKIIWERKDARRFNKVLDLWVFDPSDLFDKASSEAVKKNPEKFRVSRVRVNNKRKNG